MASKLEVTPSYLSAVENGKRNVPQSWGEKLANLYSLNADSAAELHQVVMEAQKAITIDFDEYNKEEITIMMDLAKRLKGLESSDKKKIKAILNKNHSENVYEKNAK